MIDIKKLEEYINENYVESDDSNETDADHRKLPSRNPLADFARKISGHGGMHGGMNPFSGMSPLKHPDFNILEKRMKTKKEDFISRLIYYINLKKMTPPQVYNAAGITPDCFSKILSGKTKHPTKEKIIAILNLSIKKQKICFLVLAIVFRFQKKMLSLNSALKTAHAQSMK